MLGKLRSIQFWLVFFFMIRLVGITNPPLERGHDWRQCLTNMMSRNLYETDNNPMYPRVDNGGRHETGIIASEFPVFNYAVYLVSIPFGYDHWYGRLINLLLSTIAAWYFYKLLKHYFTQSIAFNAIFLLLVSIWFGFGRKTMPDVFSMSLMVIALYHAFLFAKKTEWWRLFVFATLATLAVLAKLPAIFAFSILALPLLSKEVKLLPKISIGVITIVVALVCYWWYFVWGDYLLKTFGYQLYFPKSFSEGINELLPHWPRVLEQFYFATMQSYIAFGMFATGLFYCIKNKLRIPLLILGFTLPVFVLFIIKTGSVFAFHNYYIIPFVPVMAIVAGIGLTYLPSKIYTFILAFIAIEAIANQQNDFFIKDSEKFKLSLEAEINKTVPAHEKIAMAGSTGPQYLYFAHRKGWGLSVEQTLDTAYMNEVKTHGYTYLVLVKREFTSLPAYRLVAETGDIKIYKID